MCSKTCTISQLFCIICTIIEIANSQPQIPISPYNYGPQMRVQMSGTPIMSNFHGMEQIVPTNNFGYSPQLPNFYKNRYLPSSQMFQPTTFGSGPFNMHNQQQDIRQQLAFQQQQHQHQQRFLNSIIQL